MKDFCTIDYEALPILSALIQFPISVFASEKNTVDLNDRLISQGFNYYNSTASTFDNYAKITYSRKLDTNTDKANAWLKIFKDDENKNIRLTFQLSNQVEYSSILKNIKTSFKFITDEIQDESVIYKYENSKYYLTASSVHSKEEYGDVSNFSTIEIVKKNSALDNKNGYKKIYDDNGNISKEYNLINNEIDGVAKFYHTNGTLKSSISYKNGVRIGQSKFYNEEGGLTSTELSIPPYKTIIEEFENGKITYKYTTINSEIQGKLNQNLYDNANNLTQIIENNYSDGKRNGPYSRLSISKDTLEYGYYKNDLKEGKFKEYISADTVIYTSYIKNLRQGAYKIESLITHFDSKTGEEGRFWSIFEKGAFKDGLKNGKAKELFMGNKSAEGEYLDNYKSGKWISYCLFPPYQNEISSISNYSKGKLEGNQFSYIQREDDSTNLKINFVKVNIKSNYKNDLLDGQEIEIDSNIKFISTYKEGQLDGDSEIFRNDTLIHRLNYNEGIIELANFYENNICVQKNVFHYRPFSFTVFHLTPDTISTYNYRYVGEEDQFNYYSRKIEDCILNGPFEIKINNSLLKSGEYSDGKLSGLLSQYYSNYNCYSIINYALSEIPTFYDNSKQLFKGKVEYVTPTTKYKFSVKDGLLDGKYQTLDLNDNLVKEQKYKKGILLE